MHGSRRRPTFAALLMLALAGYGAVASAVEFDEKLKAPAMTNAAALHTQAKAFAEKLAQVRASTPEQLVLNNALARQQFDFNWQVQRAIDERKPLEEMAELGLIGHEDGSYTVDTGKYPLWTDITDTLIGLTRPDFLAGTEKALVQRGFRPEDVQVFDDYVNTHDFQAAVATASHPAALGFGRTVRKYDKLKLQVPDSLVQSYFYQRMRISSDAHRAWAQGLLKLLDAQRVRILMSACTEGSGTLMMIPEDPTTAIADTLSQVRMPDFEQRVNAEAKGVAP